MATKPKKNSRSKKMDTQNAHLVADPTPVQPAAAAPTMSAPQTPQLAAGTLPPIGSYLMALSPAVNGQWQMSRVVANPMQPNMPLVEFPDGTQYIYDQVQVSAPIAPNAQSAPNPANPSHIDLIGSLKPSYQQYLSDIVNLYAGSHELFQLPLDAVITMARRNAYQQQIDSSGKMDTLGNEANFVPDTQTFERWVKSYLEEVQRREQSAGTAAPAA